jgi:hypothetical protein
LHWKKPSQLTKKPITEKAFTSVPSPGKTATTGGDLPDIIGFELADIIENQYSILQNLAYYVNLMTQLWFASDSIEGKKEMQEGFRKNIINSLQEAIEYHPYVIQKITESQKTLKH